MVTLPQVPVEQRRKITHVAVRAQYHGELLRVDWEIQLEKMNDNEKPNIPTPTRIDGVNYVRRTIDILGQPVQLEGLTVRALRKLLENANQDGVVCYMAEQDEATRNCQLIVGVIAGAGIAGNATYLFGPEGVRAIDAHLKSEAEQPAQSGTAGYDDHGTLTTSPPWVNRSNTDTTDGRPLDQRPETDSLDGQHSNYLVLSDDERAKGFVRPYRDAYRHKTCGKITTMGRKIAETYARDPKFYGATFCSTCKGHFPVGEDGEFTWYEMDGTEGPEVGT